jgi:hypothetical protein
MSASQVARITGVSHWYLAGVFLLMTVDRPCHPLMCSSQLSEFLWLVSYFQYYLLCGECPALGYTQTFADALTVDTCYLSSHRVSQHGLFYLNSALVPDQK